MANIKLGNTVYRNIDRVQFSDENSSGVVNFMPADPAIAAFTQASAQVIGGYYEDPNFTSITVAGLLFVSMFETVYLPNLVNLVSSIGGAASRISCKNFIAPRLKSFEESFTASGLVETIDVTDLESCRFYSFAGTHIKNLIFRGNQVPTTNAGMASVAGSSNVSLYVPSAMIASYQANADFATLVSNKGWQIKAIEGSQYQDTEWFKS